jgi:hypothetical protein
MYSSVSQSQPFCLIHRITHQSLVNSCDFWQFPKSKNPANRAIAGFYTFDSLWCDPAGIRTQDHYIKSVMLYQLSYGIKVLLNFTLSVSV